MNEDEATRLLANLGEQVPVGPAPIDVTLRQGKGNSARRRAIQVVSGAAAVAVIAVGAFILGPSIGGSGNLATRPTAEVAPRPPGTTSATTKPREPRKSEEGTPIKHLRQKFVGQGVNDTTEALQRMGYLVSWRWLRPTDGKTFGTVAEVRVPNPEEVILLVWPPPDCPDGRSPLSIPSGDCSDNNEPIDISSYIGQTAEYAKRQLSALGAGPIRVRLTGFTNQRCCDNSTWRPTDIVTGIARTPLSENAFTNGFVPQGEPLFLHVRASTAPRESGAPNDNGTPVPPSDALIAGEALRAHLTTLFEYHKSDISKIWVNESFCAREPVADRDNGCRLWTAVEREELKGRLSTLGAVSFVPTRAGLEPPPGVAYASAVHVSEQSNSSYSVHVFAHDGDHAWWGNPGERPCGWQVWTLAPKGSDWTATLNEPVRSCG